MKKKTRKTKAYKRKAQRNTILLTELNEIKVYTKIQIKDESKQDAKLTKFLA